MRRFRRTNVTAVVRFWNELRRRRVIRVGVAYLVGVWVLIEVSSVLLPAIGLPESGVTIIVVLAALGLPVALLLSWIFDVTPEGLVRSHEESGAASTQDIISVHTPVYEEPEEGSVAVLAFADRSEENNQEYLADGISEELLNSLRRIQGIRIAARSSAFAFKGENRDIRDIGRQLNVAKVIDGSVRKSGDQLRISAELIDVASGFSLWMNTYDRPVDEVFKIQDDIARCIVHELELALPHNHSDRQFAQPGTGNHEAYQCYLKGRYYWNSRYAVGLERGIENFQEAVTLDPDFALPWTGLADSYNLLAFYNFVSPEKGFAQARESAERAMALDRELAESNSSIAFVRAFNDWDFVAAEAGYRKALEINPQYGPARFWYAFLLVALGRVSEAIDQIEKAKTAEPFSPIINGGASYLDYFLRRHEPGCSAAQEVLAADPNFGPAYMFLGFHCLAVDRPEEAVRYWQKALDRQDRLLIARLMLACSLARSNDCAAAERVLAPLDSLTDAYVSSYFRAATLLALGDRESALDNLEIALRERNNFLLFLGTDTLFQQLHEEPRFLHVLECVGVPLQPPAIGQRTA